MVFPRKIYEPLSTDTKNMDVLEFQITDIYVPEADRYKDKDYDELYSLIIYGTCENGATISVVVEKFKPFFYVKPPESWESLSNSAFETKVAEMKSTLLNKYYMSRYGTQEYEKRIIPKNMVSHFDDITIVQKKDFWGFTNNKMFRFIKLSVKSLKLYNNLKYYFKTLEKEGFKAYESNIDPFLKYIHIQDIKPCNWVRIEKYKIGDDISRCDYNIVVNHKNIKPIDVNKIAPILITSFDIECTSSHGDFPVAKKNYSKVAQDLALVAKAGYEYTSDFIIYWIQSIYSEEVVIDESIDLKINRVFPKNKIKKDYIEKIPGLLEPIMSEIISILDKISSSISTNDPTRCAGIDDAEDNSDDDCCDNLKLTVGELNAEESRLAKMLDKVLIRLEGDKIIQIGTTVHIYGSDKIVYKNIITIGSCDLIKDSEVVSCKDEKELLFKWKELMNNLNSDIVAGYNIFGFDMPYIWERAEELGIIDEYKVGFGRLITRTGALVEQKLSSSAMGDNILKYIDMDGVVLIDLLKVMQREQKLDSYKLDNVASIFLGDNKNDLKPQEIFDKFKGTSKDRCDIAEYCIQDCCLINRLIHKLKIIENNIGMGNVCLVPLNFLFRRGQGIKIFSLIAKQCMEKNSLIPTIKSYNDNVIDIDDDGYEGAVVLEPKEAIYLNEPIVVFDYGSLYPSSMISCNLSHDCYLIDEKYRVEDPNIEYKKIAYDLYEGKGDKKKKVGEKECTFIQYKDGKKGIISEILDMLLTERKNTRKKIEYKTLTCFNGDIYSGFCADAKAATNAYEILNIDTGEKKIVNKADVENIKDTYNTFEQDVFDALQLAYKITANSLYGQIGARTSSIYLKEIAACTTATGREMIMLAKKFVEDNYGADVIYGDTDSIFCKFPLKDSEGNIVLGKDALPYAIKMGQEVEKEIAKIMPKPQKLNYEKSLYPFILLSKKRYVGNLYEMDINKYKQKSMGIVLKRRDNAHIVKKIYGGVIDIILQKQDLQMSIEFLKEELQDLVDGKTSINELVITKSIRASYKDPSKIAHKVLADRIGARDPGNRPSVNERIPFVYIKTDNPNSLQGDRIENPEYIVENKLTPDYLHYITNQIMKPLIQLYALCLDLLPGYDKDDEYWEELDKSLLIKTMYVDDTRRKNRIQNLKSLMVKDLLFSKYIDILSEPKIRRISKAAPKKKTVTKNGKDVAEDVGEDAGEAVASAKNSVVTISTESEKLKRADNKIPTGTLKVDIKITKDKDSGKLVADSYISDGKNKIWKYNNDNCHNKESEILRIVAEIIKTNREKTYIITVNNKKFVSDYNNALVSYKELIQQTPELNMLENIFTNQSIGQLALITKIRRFSDIIVEYKSFSFAIK
jgi:DNA polymerase elongation subunit (family B)